MNATTEARITLVSTFSNGLVSTRSNTPAAELDELQADYRQLAAESGCTVEFTVVAQ